MRIVYKAVKHYISYCPTGYMQHFSPIKLDDARAYSPQNLYLPLLSPAVKCLTVGKIVFYMSKLPVKPLVASRNIVLTAIPRAPYSKICYFRQITKNDNIILSFSAKYYEIVDILE